MNYKRGKDMKRKLLLISISLIILSFANPSTTAADAYTDAMNTATAVSVISLIISIILFIAILLICYNTVKIKELLQIMLDWQIDHERKEWDRFDKPWRAYWQTFQPKTIEKKITTKPKEFCPKCGERNEENTKFCKRCGHNLGV